MSDKNNLSSKFELLNFIMDSKERTRAGNVTLHQDEEEDEHEEEEEEEEEEDPERDLEALYEQKEMSLGDLSSKSSQISNVSDSSEECNIILTNSPEALKVGAISSLDHYFAARRVERAPIIRRMLMQSEKMHLAISADIYASSSACYDRGRKNYTNPFYSQNKQCHILRYVYIHIVLIMR